MTKPMTPREARIEEIAGRYERGEISWGTAQELIVLADEESR